MALKFKQQISVGLCDKLERCQKNEVSFKRSLMKDVDGDRKGGVKECVDPQQASNPTK